MTMEGVAPAPLTEAEYLELDRAAPYRSEYRDGAMFEMSGGTFAHSLLSTAVQTILHRQAPAGCRTFNSDLRIRIPAAGLCTYPDAGMVCGEPQFAEASPKDTLLNPVLLVEVLSPTTEAYDRGRKFESYRSIESLREYLLVHQDRQHVEHYSRQEDGGPGWVLREYAGPEAVAGIDRLGIRIPLAELYAGIVDEDSAQR